MKRKGRKRTKSIKTGIPNVWHTGQIRDVNSRMVFKDSMLCAQFLRDYVDIPLLKNVQPEDIEDVSQKYQAYLGITFESDTVKKVRLKGVGQEDGLLYMVSLIEHKSSVDYDVSMQMLRYMACIWHEYGKEMEQMGKGDVARKDFKYPPILPVVYYEGTGEWTACLHLKERIMMGDIFEAYLPDFTYKLVKIHGYTDEELLEKKDEMSLLMMINKLQTSDDVNAFWQEDRAEKMNKIIKDTPEQTLDIIASVIWSLLMKLNVPVEEAEQYVGKIKERQMGYLFENMEKMDIQEERRKTEEERKKAEKERKKGEKERKRAEEERKRAEEERKRAEEEHKRAEEEHRRAEEQSQKVKETEKKLQESREHEIAVVVSLCMKFHATKDSAISQVMENSGLPYAEAERKVNKYWKEE